MEEKTLIELNTRKDNIEPLKDEVIQMIIPECCREGWDSCIHVPKREKKKKYNIGL